MVVTGLVRGADWVKYVLTDNDFLVVDGVVGPTQSTMAGWVELLPFKVCVYVCVRVYVCVCWSHSER